MQITFAEIDTSLLLPTDTHKIYDVFFSRCSNIRKLNDKMVPAERDDLFLQLCASIKDPEEYSFFVKRFLILVRCSILTKKPSLSVFSKGVYFLIHVYRRRKDRKIQLCNHIWNLYQDIKNHGIVEPLSVCYLKRRRSAVAVILLAFRSIKSYFSEGCSAPSRNGIPQHCFWLYLKFLWAQVGKVFQFASLHGVVRPLMAWYKDVKQETLHEYSVVVGSSRLWAAQKLGIDKIKCIVFDLSDSAMVEGKRISLQDIQSYFTSPVKLRKVSTARYSYYAVHPQHFHMKEGSRHWADGDI